MAASMAYVNCILKIWWSSASLVWNFPLEGCFDVIVVVVVVILVSICDVDWTGRGHPLYTTSKSSIVSSCSIVVVVRVA